MTALGKFRKDAELIKSGTVKAAAGTNYSDAVDLGEVDSQGLRSEDFELLVTLPACSTTHFPTNTACAFALLSSNDADFASGVTTHQTVNVTGGTAYAGGSFKFKPSENGDRYWKISATTTLSSGATTGTGADKLTYTLEYVA